MNTITIRRIWVLTIPVTAAALAALALAQSIDPARSAPPRERSATPTALAQLAAAERVCKMLHDRETGAPAGHQGVEHTYLWSKRRMEAQREVEMAKGGDGATTAIEEHLARMRAWNERVSKSGDFSAFDIASTEYYVTEAEDLLARAKAK